MPCTTRSAVSSAPAWCRRRCASWCARIEARGGAAKVSGAGALAGPGAGCLVIYHPHPASLGADGLIAPESLLPVRLGAEGLRVERA